MVCSALPESPNPGLSLSDLPQTAAAAAASAEFVLEFVLVGWVEYGFDEVDDCGGCFDVRSVITTPLLDGRWDENALTHTNMLVAHTLRQKV